MTLPEPSVCETCGGCRVAAMQWAGGSGWLYAPCLDCCCPCGEYTGGGFCRDCEDRDWVDCELAYQRGADR